MDNFRYIWVKDAKSSVFMGLKHTAEIKNENPLNDLFQTLETR